MEGGDRMGEICVNVISSVEACLSGGSPRLWRRVAQALSFEYPNARFMTHVVAHAKALAKFHAISERDALQMAVAARGRKNLFSLATGRFPAGLLPRVVALVPKATVIDGSNAIALLGPECDRITPKMLEGIVLRPDQLEAIRKAALAKRGILKAATNFGKSEAAAALIKASSPKARVLFLVHTRVLVRQTRARLALRLGILEDLIGVVGDGQYRPRRITVATSQSLHNLLKKKDKQAKKWLSLIDVLFLDEAHHQRAATFYPVSMACLAPFRFGLSATPGETDGDRLMVEAVTGPIIHEVKNEELIRLGVSALPIVEILSPGGKQIDSEWEWSRVYREGIVENVDRNVAIAEKVGSFVRDGLQVLILVAQVWHGELLSTLFRANGVRHEFVHAKLHDEQIDEAKARFEARKIPLLIASPVFGEGVDIPTIEALVIADGGKSLRSILQKVGRALRKKKTGENVVRIVDFADEAHPMLARHSMRRIDIYRREKFKVVAA